MHFVQVKGILSPHNGMNIYRGCSHGCIYCDSRSTCYQMKHEFTDIEVKENALELLEYQMRHKRNKCMIGTGAMSDPYMPIEKTLKYTRKSLELANIYHFGFTFQTKSDLCLRDLDIMKQIQSKTKMVVQMTLTTYDEKLCKILEPNVCTTKRRLEVLKTLHENGIETIVWITPLLPFINDTEENLRGILAYCKEAHVKGIIFFGISLTLREGDREFYYKNLDAYFPGLKEKYIQKYGDSYELVSPNDYSLSRIFHSFCEENHIMHDNDEIFHYLHKYESKDTQEQLKLF